MNTCECQDIMIVDNATLQDLAVFSRDEQHSVFHLLDFTHSSEGRDVLKGLMLKPLSNAQSIVQRQRIIQHLSEKMDRWPSVITNGTVMVIDKFFKTPVSNIPFPVNSVNVFTYRIVNRNGYSLVKYTVGHLYDLLRGMRQLYEALYDADLPVELQSVLNNIHAILSKPDFNALLQSTSKEKITPARILESGYQLLRRKNDIRQLLHLYGRLDAWQSVAAAMRKYHLVFPEIVNSGRQVVFDAVQLFHPLLQHPVAYDVQLDAGKNFLFLTGANMAGKSTFIKAVGISVLLAHLGFGVPAKSMKISVFDGLLSNIQVTDNILQGESYFYNEVQRIRQTVDRVKDGQHWFILIDELFKGTNVQDAMRCSTAVVEGLSRVPTSLFILSTHLYEIASPLAVLPNILFKYFETRVHNKELSFSYRLRDGVSDDRIGYLIMDREGLIEDLKALSEKI